MKPTFTILALFLLTNALAQRVQYTQPEKGYNSYANYDIIGHVGRHNLIFIKGDEGAEIAVYDDAMQKLARVPANILGATASKVDFVAYTDHFLAFFQYKSRTAYYCAAFKGDADGRVVEGPVILDSIPSVEKYDWQYRLGANETKLTHPAFILLHSENKQWYMLVKSVQQENGAYQTSTVLYGRDLEPLDRSSFTYFPPANFSECSEFILDNDGDLAFAGIGRNEEGERVRRAKLLIKTRGADSLSSVDLSGPGMELEDLRLKVDNDNRRYILTSFYYAPGAKNLTGLCNMIWEKPAKILVGPSLNPLPQDVRNEVITNFSNPAQLLDYFYLRQILVLSDGGFMVLAELFHETLVDRGLPYWGLPWKRDDFIRGKKDMIFTPPQGFLSYDASENPGFWSTSPFKENIKDTYQGDSRSTENVLVFIMNKAGKTSGIKVIRKYETSILGLLGLSFQTLITGEGVHLIYNEPVRERYLPTLTTIRADGTLEQGQVWHDLDMNPFFFPLYGKQVGPNTMIIPCEIKKTLCFARVEY